jgi:prolyl oligopeptidase
MIYAYLPLALEGVGVPLKEIPSLAGLSTAGLFIIGAPQVPIWLALAELRSRRLVVVRSGIIALAALVAFALAREAWQLVAGTIALGFWLGNTGVMLATIRETDFDETLGKGLSDEQLFKSFIEHHRNLDNSYWQDGESMMRDYRELCKRIDPELPRLFGTMPRNPYGVREIPRFAAKTSPVAYYYSGSARAGTPGYFMVNTTNLRQRPKYAMVSLTIHEAVPGHHFQIALADELEGVHPFRTQLGYTAFVEGWGLYSERLGLEMAGGNIGNALTPATLAPNQRGLYANPMDNAGRLSDELWRACRLVVDTGLHAFNWPREKAIAYLLENTAITELDAASEVDRYIGWPGQACAYKIGQLKILELRQRAQTQLGEKFDVRRFHDTILLGGSLPLPVLEERVNRWLASQ